MSALSFSMTLYKLVSSTALLTIASLPIPFNPRLEYFKWCHAYNAQFLTTEVMVFVLYDLTKEQWKHFCAPCLLTPRFTFFHFWKDLCLGTQGSSTCECWAEDAVFIFLPLGLQLCSQRHFTHYEVRFAVGTHCYTQLDWILCLFPTKLWKTNTNWICPKS